MRTTLLIEFFMSTSTSIANVERLTNPPNETAAETPTVTFIPKTAKFVPLQVYRERGGTRAKLRDTFGAHIPVRAYRDEPSVVARLWCAYTTRPLHEIRKRKVKNVDYRFGTRSQHPE
jgi:hypothetical protein